MLPLYELKCFELCIWYYTDHEGKFEQSKEALSINMIFVISK